MSYQIWNAVFGIEGDVTHIQSETKSFFRDVGAGDYTTNLKITGLATLRARAGVALGQVQIYGTGGVAYSKSSLQITSVDIFGTEVWKDTTSDIGYVYGGGFDWRLDDRLSFNLEALKYKFNSFYDLYGDGEGPRDIFDLTTVRAGLTYHFR